MKLKLLVLILINCYLIKAQPVLTRSNYFYIGDSTLTYVKSDSALVGFNTGLSGANVTWDYSSMDFNHPSVGIDTTYYIDPVGTPYYPSYMAANYSQSNFCYLVKTNHYSPFNYDFNYCYMDSNSLSFIGHWPGAHGNELWEDHCTDFMKLLSFPFQFQENFIDSFSRFYYDMSGSDDHYQTGTNSVTADGFGTLITPDGTTLTDILRIHEVIEARDSNFTFGITNTSIHNYYWYSSNLRGFILKFQMYYTDSTRIASAHYQKQTNFNITVNKINANSNPVQFFPNPGNGRYEFKTTLSDMTKIEVYNSLGQMVFSERRTLNNGLNELDVSDLPAGIYCVQMISSEKNLFAGRVIIE